MKHTNFFKIVVILSICVVLFIVIFEFRGENKKISLETLTKKEEPKVIKMIMAGDVLIHNTVYNDAKKGDTYDFSHMFEYIKPIMKDYDLAFYNQESIIGGKKLGLSNYPRFNSPEEIGDTMVSLGFNLVSLANNHTLDKGEVGVLNSVNYWQEKDVLTAGSYDSLMARNTPRIKEINGITYTMLSYTTATNGLYPESGKEYLTNIYDEEKVKEDIERLKEKVDLLIVSMHWGEEYRHTPTAKQRQIAEYLSSLGVHLIIGHHPHVLEPIVYINDTLVIYSLGNFLSGQIGVEKEIGALVSIDIHKKNTGIKIDDIMVRLTYTSYDKNYRNYKVIPFDLLDDSILKDYDKYYETYSDIIKGNDSVQVINLR